MERRACPSTVALQRPGLLPKYDKTSAKFEISLNHPGLAQRSSSSPYLHCRLFFSEFPNASSAPPCGPPLLPSPRATRLPTTPPRPTWASPPSPSRLSWAARPSRASRAPSRAPSRGALGSARWLWLPLRRSKSLVPSDAWGVDAMRGAIGFPGFGEVLGINETKKKTSKVQNVCLILIFSSQVLHNLGGPHTHPYHIISEAQTISPNLDLQPGDGWCVASGSWESNPLKNSSDSKSLTQIIS